VFCQARVIRDADQQFAPKHAVTTALHGFHACAISEAEILQELEISQLAVNDKQAIFIDSLLGSRADWLPSILDQPWMFGHDLADQVEGFLGSVR
jgi:hypothetical protein